MSEKAKADFRGIFIPENLYKLDIEMSMLEDGVELEALLDDMDAEDWVVRWAHRNNHDVTKVEKVATGLSMTIKKGGYRVET